MSLFNNKNVGGMNLLNHDGLDVRTQEVDEARRLPNGSIIPLRALALSHFPTLLCSATYLGIDARALEIAVQMTFAVLVALFEQPAIAAFRISQDLPAIIVAQKKKL